MFRFVRNPDPRKKPPYGSRIDPTHPLAQGLVGCWLFNEGGGSPFSLGEKQTSTTIVGNPVFEDSYISFDGADDYIRSDFEVPEYDAITIVIRVRPKEASDGGYFAICTYDSNDDSYTAIRWDAPNRCRAIFANKAWDYYTRRLDSPDNSITQNVFQDIAFTANTVPELALYIDGTLVADTAVTADAAVSGAGYCYIGAGVKGSAYCDIERIYFFRRTLTVSEIFQLYAEPYSFILVPHYWHMVDFGAASGSSLVRIINETLNFNESISKLSSTNKIVNETLHLDETYPKLQATNKIINETLQIDESNEKKGAVSKIIDESLQISESLVKKGHTKKIINEQIQVSEALSKRGSTKKVVNESLELNENISKVSGIIKVVSETLQISELVAKIPGITKVVNETLQFSESIFRKTGITKVVNEALQIVENISKRSWTTKIVNEALNLSESVFKRGVVKKIINETLQLSENVIRRSGLVRIINETLRISENITRSLAVALGWREVLEADSLITLEVSKKSAITTEISDNSPLD